MCGHRTLSRFFMVVWVEEGPHPAECLLSPCARSCSECNEEALIISTQAAESAADHLHGRSRFRPRPPAERPVKAVREESLPVYGDGNDSGLSWRGSGAPGWQVPGACPELACPALPPWPGLPWAALPCPALAWPCCPTLPCPALPCFRATLKGCGFRACF